MACACEIYETCAECRLTERERVALVFLSDKMEAHATMVGKAVYQAMKKYGTLSKAGGSNIECIGAVMMGRMKKRELVTYLPDLHAWRITRRGREVLRRAIVI